MFARSVSYVANEFSRDIGSRNIYSWNDLRSRARSSVTALFDGAQYDIILFTTHCNYVTIPSIASRYNETLLENREFLHIASKQASIFICPINKHVFISVCNQPSHVFNAPAQEDPSEVSTCGIESWGFQVGLVKILTIYWRLSTEYGQADRRQDGPIYSKDVRALH